METMLLYYRPWVQYFYNRPWRLHGDNIIDHVDNTSIIDRGDPILLSNIDHGDKTSIIDRGANTSIL